MRVLSDTEVAEEVDFIETHQMWPLYPVLPVKHIHRGSSGHPEDEDVGVMVAGHGPKIYLINLLELRTGVLTPQLEGVRVLEFETMQALVREGWLGD